MYREYVYYYQTKTDEKQETGAQRVFELILQESALTNIVESHFSNPRFFEIPDDSSQT